MPRLKSIIDEETINKANEALKEIKDSKIVLKLLSIRALQNYTYKKVSMMFNVSRISLTKWAKGFKEYGVEGLKDHPKGHRPSKLSIKQMKEIETWILEGKDNKGKQVIWTIYKLKGAIKEVMGIEVGKTPLWLRMKKTELVLKKPRPEHYKADKKLQEAFKKN